MIAICYTRVWTNNRRRFNESIIHVIMFIFRIHFTPLTHVITLKFNDRLGFNVFYFSFIDRDTSAT